MIPRSELPQEAVAVLSGHIHREQVLASKSLDGKTTPPVIYPGSIERTSFAEHDERKGFYELILAGNHDNGWGIKKLKFIELPARTMEELYLERWLTNDDLENYFEDKLRKFDPNSIVRLRCDPEIDPDVKSRITSKFLRDIMPDTMNFQFSADFRE